MSESNRDERLLREYEAMQALKTQSSILNFEAKGDPPDRYTVTFRGKGVHRENSSSSSSAEVTITELHRCEIRLAYSYPERGPDLRWLTPILHPNISFSGMLSLKDIDLPWEKDLTLDIVCERLWDMVRMAHYNLDKAVNYAAKSWFEKDSTLRLPLDHRPLRDQIAPSGSNIITYERRGGRRVSLPESPAASEVMFIGDDAPAASIKKPPVQRHVRDAIRKDDDDVLFIGYD